MIINISSLFFEKNVIVDEMLTEQKPRQDIFNDIFL
jgi:hypothetical protein